MEKQEINKKCAELLGLDGIIVSNEIAIVYEGNDEYGKIHLLFNIFNPNSVDAYKVAEKLNINIVEAHFGNRYWRAYIIEKSENLFMSEDKDQHTTIIRCIESCIESVIPNPITDNGE